MYKAREVSRQEFTVRGPVGTRCPGCGQICGILLGKNRDRFTCTECRGTVALQLDRLVYTPERIGVAITALFRDMLVEKGWITYAVAESLSGRFDERLKDADWLELLDGTTFTRSR